MNKDKIILDLCGGSGSWSKPYKDNGYDVRNITLPKYDIRLYKPPKNVYGILSAPPCTQFSFAKSTGNPRDLKDGMKIVIACLNIIWNCQYHLETPFAKKTTLKFWVMENPRGLLKRFLGKPCFEFHPWEFGNPYKKGTHLWGYFNNPIKIYSKIEDVMTNEEIKLCKTNSRKLPIFKGLKTSQEKRSITPQGFAQAFYQVNK